MFLLCIQMYNENIPQMYGKQRLESPYELQN